jgi:hypothetical protein
MAGRYAEDRSMQSSPELILHGGKVALLLSGSVRWSATSRNNKTPVAKRRLKSLATIFPPT